MSGTPSPKQSCSSGSGASFIKVVQQLIQSDQQEIKANKMLWLQSQFGILKKMLPSLSNQDKLHLFLRDNTFKQKLYQSLAEKFGTEKVPILKIRIYSIRFRTEINEQLDETDLIKLFQKFGQISFIFVQKLEAYVLFSSIISSYIAIKTLNQFQIVRDSLRLQVRWCKPEEEVIAEQYFDSKFSDLTSAFSSQQRVQKFNCKYKIELQCWPEFKLPQKIIGPKGNNMKKLFEQIAQKNKIASVKELQTNLKMRLRGKGSGYKQGSQAQQSDETLNFCISAKQKSLYESACLEAQKILQKLAVNYKFQYERIRKQVPQGIVYVKYESFNNQYIERQSLRLEEISSFLPEISQSSEERFSENDVELLVNKRNKARKAGRFKQADQIRQKLKLKGVVLIDGNGKKNNGSTTWKYSYD